MTQKYIPCPVCGGALHPKWFPMVDEAGRTKYVLDTLQCSYCGRRQPTSDLTPAEYKRMIAESDEKSLVLDDDGR